MSRQKVSKGAMLILKSQLAVVKGLVIDRVESGPTENTKSGVLGKMSSRVLRRVPYLLYAIIDRYDD